MYAPCISLPLVMTNPFIRFENHESGSNAGFPMGSDFACDAFGHLKAIAVDKGGRALLKRTNVGQGTGVVAQAGLGHSLLGPVDHGFGKINADHSSLRPNLLRSQYDIYPSTATKIHNHFTLLKIGET